VYKKICRHHSLKLTYMLNRTQPPLTYQFLYTGLYVYILQVLHSKGVVQPQCYVITYRHPDAVSRPGQQPHLTVLRRVSFERCLRYYIRITQLLTTYLLNTHT